MYQRNFKTSIPDDRSRSCRIVDDFVEECTEWDEVEVDEFELDSGENVQSKFLCKYLNENKERFINWRQVVVNDKILYQGSKLVEKSDETKGSENYLSVRDTKLLNRIDGFLDEKRILKKVFWKSSWWRLRHRFYCHREYFSHKSTGWGCIWWP